MVDKKFSLSAGQLFVYMLVQYQGSLNSQQREEGRKWLRMNSAQRYSDLSLGHYKQVEPQGPPYKKSSHQDSPVQYGLILTLGCYRSRQSNGERDQILNHLKF